MGCGVTVQRGATGNGGRDAVTSDGEAARQVGRHRRSKAETRRRQGAGEVELYRLSRPAPGGLTLPPSTTVTIKVS
jgi:hypothetical protein